MNTSVAQKPQSPLESVSRREFLYYLGGASAALFALGSCAALNWFTQEQVRYGRESGMFQLEAAEWPELDTNPVNYSGYRAYLTTLPEGAIAHATRCPYDEVLFRWTRENNRYECPACGSKYQVDGTFIEGPACRHLDRFGLTVVSPDGTRVQGNGEPTAIEGAAEVILDTRTSIYRTFSAGEEAELERQAQRLYGRSSWCFASP